MAKFCKYCGNVVEEGKICNCPDSLENAAKIVNTVGATIETTENVKNNSKRLLELTKEYLGEPIETTKKVIREKDNAFIIYSGALFVLSIMLNFFTIFGRTFGKLNKFIGSLGRDYGLSFSELKEYKVDQNYLALFFYSLVFAISVLIIYSLTVLIISKINKTTYESKDIFYVSIINTISLSLCLIVGGILSLFVSYKIILLIQLLYIVVYIVIGIISCNIIIGEFNKGQTIILYSIITLLGIIIINTILIKVIPAILSKYEMGGKTLEYYIDNIMDEFKDSIDNIYDIKDIFRYGIF